jgi:phosphohistidine phosphatase
MKRTLIVMRHAKTEPQQISQKDFERNLLRKGEEDALGMSKNLALKNIIPETIIASSANRTQQTASIVAETLGLNASKINLFQQLYLCDSEIIESTVAALPDELQTCMIVGHNPGVSDYIYEACPQIPHIDLPTSGLVVLSGEAINWQSFSTAKKTIELYDYPNIKL